MSQLQFLKNLQLRKLLSQKTLKKKTDDQRRTKRGGSIRTPKIEITRTKDSKKTELYNIEQHNLLILLSACDFFILVVKSFVYAKTIEK